jgi:predicted transcriptional regulator
VVHGPEHLDPLAVDLAKKEGLVLALSHSADESDIISSLSTLGRERAKP